MEIQNPVEIAAAVRQRHAELIGLLGELGDDDLRALSLLEGWDRLTIVCHLRYGAIASRAITVDTLAGRRAAFYPEGRQTQRSTTLLPTGGERPQAVVVSLAEESVRLDELWAKLDFEQWSRVAHEPDDNPDLGSISLSMVALLRLTEIEVHGHDLAIEAGRWSDVFVDTALPARLRWLPTRRSNHGLVDGGVVGRWVLEAIDGPTFAVEATPTGVDVEDVHTASDGDAIIGGTKRDLLAFLLGRADLDQLEIDGDHGFAASFRRAFPGP